MYLSVALKNMRGLVYVSKTTDLYHHCYLCLSAARYGSVIIGNQ